MHYSRNDVLYQLDTDEPMKNSQSRIDYHYAKIARLNYSLIYHATLSTFLLVSTEGQLLSTTSLKQNSFLACRSKEKQFFTIATIKGTNESQLSMLNYDEYNQRKSVLTSRIVNGNATGVYPLEEFLLLTVKAYNSSTIWHYSYDCFQYGIDGKVIYSQYYNIRSIVLKKGNKEGFLCSTHSISQFDTYKGQVGYKFIVKEHYVSHCLIDPLHYYLTYATNGTVYVCDKNSPNDKYVLKTAKNGECDLTGLDYNPNKQYYLMTSHHECLKFWDIRRGNVPVKCFDYHHSLVLDAKYNHSHDELLGCCYDDGSVGLFRMSSISSAPASESYDTLIKQYDEHYDSVYKIAWSTFSPWIFASLSFDASNLVINVVPSVYKYRILL